MSLNIISTKLTLDLAGVERWPRASNTMKKICNIDGIAVYARNGIAFDGWSSKNLTKRNLDWAKGAFSEPQLNMLNTHGYVLRSHPRHSPTIEVFIDDKTMSPEDWTMLRLLF